MVFLGRYISSLLLLFFCFGFMEAASRGGRRRDTLNGLQGQLRALEEAQEEARGELATLQRGVADLTKLVTASLPEDCWAARARGSRRRVVTVKPPGQPVREVACDQEQEGGGWTLVLHRFPASANHSQRLDFNRTWQEYREGFGDLQGEFWLGNEALHALTSQAPQQLYVTLTDWTGKSATGIWNHFKVANEAASYQLSVGEYQTSRSTVGDSFARHHQHAFSTFDHDNDIDADDHCARRHGGGWWYFRCYMSHLTGAAVKPGDGGHNAIIWRGWAQNTGLRSATMMIRPRPAPPLLLDTASVCSTRP